MEAVRCRGYYSPSMVTALQVRDLVKRYGSLVAVDRVSFAVEEGEVFGILGPNGAGKTTTVEMIEGLRRPDSGSITLLGKDALHRKQWIKEIIGVQLQSATLYDKIRVREAIDLFGGYYSRSIPTDELLEEVSLVEKQGDYVSTLSGGQRQRLALALALVNDPRVLFLDEPTTGLDPQARRNLWGIISELKDTGKTVLLTTHYMEEAEELCGRVAIMDHGRIIALGSPEALIAGAGLEAKVELGEVPEGLRAAIEEAGLPARITGDGGKLFLHTTEASRVLREVTRIAGERGDELGEIAVRKATLEDLFLSLTGRQLRE